MNIFTLKLSGLKNWFISRDLQDIYRFAPLGAGTSDDCDKASPKCMINYAVHSDDKVLALMQQIYPQSRRDCQFVRRRLANGDKAIIGSCDGQPVFYGWLMLGEIEVTYGVFRRLDERTAFGYNLHTRKSHRRLGVMSGFYRFVAKDLRMRRFERFYVGIDSDNEASIKAHEKNGFRKEGFFYTIKLLGTCFTLARFPGVKQFFLSSPK